MADVTEPVQPGPGSRTPAPQGADNRLARGVLSNVDIATSTMANIAPAMSFFFGFGLIASTAGVPAPLTVIAAMIAIGLLGNTLTQFSRVHPSTGSFVTFIGRAFGPYVAVLMALVLSIGYIVAVASVVGISGGWTSDILRRYLHIHIPWQILTFVLVGIALAMIVRGAKVSTKAAAVFFSFELGLMFVIAIALLIKHGGSLNLHPFDPGRLAGGFSGLSLGFPLAIYLFIGWENSAALAEESEDPRVGIGKAILWSILLLGGSYILFAYTTVIAFGENVKALNAATPVPFVAAAQQVASFLAFLAYIAGFTSIFGTLLSASNSQARIIFNSGREGLLPSWMGRVTRESRTPYAAFIVYLGIALGLTYVFGWSTPPTLFFGEISTMGTILVIVTYLVANLALPVYFRRFHPEMFSPLKHLLLPLLGAFAVGYPLYELVKPGQPKPFSEYPLIALGVIVAAAVWAAIANARDRTLGERVGAIVADAE
ncbi:MAG TPA: APC family permease [Solirubrobacteraceae bacterium]|nr:APC family permease [Solirubrobacteraceae bacterium]